MRCPTCGHYNNDLATRCSACGAPLPMSNEAEATAEATLPRDPAPTASATPARVDVRDGSPMMAGLRRAGAFFGSHQRVLGLSIAVCVIVTIAVVWAVATFGNAPSYAQIEDDMATRMSTFHYAGGTYGPDLDIPLARVSITKRERAKTPQGLEQSTRGGAWRVEAEAVYDDDSMHVVRNVGATYVNTDGTWGIAGELEEQGSSLTALAGVDTRKVLDNMGSILQATGNAETLEGIYEGGAFEIAGSNFEKAPEKDTATDDVVISCTRSDRFFSYAGNVTARFAFESGAWRLRSAEATEDATRRDYAPLVGTWTGSMVSHEALGGNCYGARDYPLVVTISSVGDSSSGGGQVQGTMTGLAHYHGRLEGDANATEGDESFSDVEFMGVISAAYDSTTGSSLNVECATAGSEQGEIEMVLSFGTDADPSAVVARVTTTYHYEELLLMLFPHQTTARFTDTYLLTRA